MFSCIAHLKQHHTLVKKDLTRMITDADNHRYVLKQRIDQIKQQQLRLNHFYEREIEQYNDMYRFTMNLCGNQLHSDNFYSLMFDYGNNAQQFDRMKQEQTQNSLIIQIDQILKEQNVIVDSGKERQE